MTKLTETQSNTLDQLIAEHKSYDGKIYQFPECGYTVAIMPLRGPGAVAVAFSRCSLDEKFNKKTGMFHALRRLYGIAADGHSEWDYEYFCITLGEGSSKKERNSIWHCFAESFVGTLSWHWVQDGR